MIETQTGSIYSSNSDRKKNTMRCLEIKYLTFVFGSMFSSFLSKYENTAKLKREHENVSRNRVSKHKCRLIMIFWTIVSPNRARWARAYEKIVLISV